MSIICGLDEAGRGPLAGPVCAGAVILPRGFPLEILNDSKKLSPAARERAKALIFSQASWGIGWASAAEIDKINILKASLLAMGRAFWALLSSRKEAGLPAFPLNEIHAVADGLFTPDIPVSREALVKADSLVPEVMAASIIAKTARDRLMEYYGLFYPEYGYEKHKGYPTKAHREAVLRWGPSPIQRKTFTVKA